MPGAVGKGLTVNGFSFSSLPRGKKFWSVFLRNLSIPTPIITATFDTKKFRGKANLTFKDFKVLFKLLNVDLDSTVIDKVLSASP